MTEAEFDPYGPDFQAEPQRVLAPLRAACPVARGQGPTSFVALLHHDDILGALRDTAMWSSAAGPGLADERSSRPVNILVNSDPPRHSAERKVIARWFRPSVVAGLEPVITSTAQALLDEFAPQRRGDVMAAVVNPLPLMVVSQMVGLAAPDIPDQLALLLDDPSLAEADVEESLRYDAPAVGLFRTPNHDVTVGGFDIAADTKTGTVAWRCNAHRNDRLR